MEKAEFLYLFVREYLHDAVMHTICIENYEGKDVDQHYIDYITKYEKVYNKLSEMSKEMIYDAFRRLRKGQLDDFHKSMISRLENNFNMSEELKQSVIERTERFRMLEKIDIEYMMVIREIEEELLILHV